MNNSKRIIGFFILLFMAIPHWVAADDTDEKARESVLEQRLSLMEFMDRNVHMQAVRTQIKAVYRRVNPSSGRRVPEDVRRLAEKSATRYGIDHNLVLAVIHIESAFDRRAVSHKGAMGYMQLMPGTAAELGVRDPFDAHQNIHGGTHYLVMMYREFGRWDYALAAYNAGPKRVKQCVERHGRIPSYTRSYVDGVLARYQHFQHHSSSVTADPEAQEVALTH